MTLLALTAWCVVASAGQTDPSTVDADGDGSPASEDCNDADDTVSPEFTEVCADRLDNDCDGLIDENCDARPQMASLRGGGGCQEGLALGLLWPGLLLLRRRRQR